MASPASAALGVVVRHMAGKHDQKTHGRKGAGEAGGLPAGWTSAEVMISGRKVAVAESIERNVSIRADRLYFGGTEDSVEDAADALAKGESIAGVPYGTAVVQAPFDYPWENPDAWALLLQRDPVRAHAMRDLIAQAVDPF